MCEQKISRLKIQRFKNLQEAVSKKSLSSAFKTLNTEILLSRKYSGKLIFLAFIQILIYYTDLRKIIMFLIAV